MLFRRRIELDCRTYLWDGRAWLDAKTFATPPIVVVEKLNALLAASLLKDDQELRDTAAIVENASGALKSRQYERAEQLARRALALAPDNTAAATVLCATLRRVGRPQVALSITSNFGRHADAPLLTTRAAAMCDLELWDDAKKEIGAALARTAEAPNDAIAVMRRIRAARPDLYSPNPAD